jgi:hypothetical protein
VSASPPSSTSPRSVRSFAYTTRPEPRWIKVLRGSLIAGVVIVIVVALVAAYWVWSALGGVEHTATDHTVSAARAKAIPTAEADVERIVTVLAPTLGQPALRAVVDACDGSPEDYTTNNIGCRRTDYLYYPTTAEPPLASVVAGLLADDAHTTVWGSYYRRGFASSSGVTPYRSGDVSIVSAPADAFRVGSIGPESPAGTVVDDEGYSEVWTAASTGANVVVEYSMAYFWG